MAGSKIMLHTSLKESGLCIGTLSAVGSLNATVELCSPTITLTWTPPFTLDITRVDPDITGYCVDIIHSTSLLTQFSSCEVNGAEFSYSAVLENSIFVVIPVNIVGNGTQQNISYSSMRSAMINASSV
jgi:hypothetical protein